MEQRTSIELQQQETMGDQMWVRLFPSMSFVDDEKTILKNTCVSSTRVYAPENVSFV
jgi:hypothetical protein